MHYLLFPVGSAGDVHPLVGLGIRLKERGHRVTVVSVTPFQALIEQVGLEYVPLGTQADYDRLTGNPDLWHPRRALPLIIREVLTPGLKLQYDLIAEHYQPGKTAVVSGTLGMGASIAQEKLGTPTVGIHLQPSVIWSEHESPQLGPMLVRPPTPRWLKRLQYRLAELLVIDRLMLPPVNEHRQAVGLSPVTRSRPLWHAPQGVVGMFPAWYAPPQPDWPPQITLTDFPRWDAPREPETSDALERFLSAGSPPVVFTPGSANLHAGGFFQAAVGACRRIGCRGLLLTRHAAQIPANLPRGVRHFPYVPLAEVLPRSAALVYHGGIGTMAAALTAGRPHLVMSLSHDQPDNAARLKRLGVGDELPPAHFTAEKVARRLDWLLTDPQVRRRCQQLAERCQGSDGLGQSCDAVEQSVEKQLQRA